MSTGFFRSLLLDCCGKGAVELNLFILGDGYSSFIFVPNGIRFVCWRALVLIDLSPDLVDFLIVSVAGVRALVGNNVLVQLGEEVAICF